MARQRVHVVNMKTGRLPEIHGTIEFAGDKDPPKKWLVFLTYGFLTACIVACGLARLKILSDTNALVFVAGSLAPLALMIVLLALDMGRGAVRRRIGEQSKRSRKYG